jgi:hypothetical protein
VSLENAMKLRRGLPLLAVLLLGSLRPVWSSPPEVGAVAEARWPGGPDDGGTVAGVTRLEGKPTAAALEVRRILDFDAARASLRDVGSVVRPASRRRSDAL